jgi:polyhydroxyalkanoate synthase
MAADSAAGAHPDLPGVDPDAQEGVALDLLLTDAASQVRDRFIPGTSALKLLASLPQNPSRTGTRATSLVTDLFKIATGRSELEPPSQDKRFADPTWRENWLFHRMMQSYLAVGHAVDVAIDDADLDIQEDRRIRLAADNLLDATAPTNFPWSNPAAMKELVNSRGASLARGIRNLAHDLSKQPRLPSNTQESDFEVGKDLAATAGAVVLRTEQLELIQYQPQTAKVRSVPIVIVPPMINKYYLLDLAPNRSLVQHLVEQGQQVFAISWRNPRKQHAHWNLDSYAAVVLEAITAATTITRTDSVHLAGSCSGGALAAAVAAHLVAIGDRDRIAGLMLAVCVIDSEQAGVASAFKSRKATEATVSRVAKKGYLDGHVLQGVFAWLRPQDLIWPYVVNNYLMGKKPPAFDILFWNADTTRLGAGLYADLADLALDNSLAHPGGLMLLGTPIDLGNVELDSYVVAGVSDHITPWQNCYRTTQLLGGDVRFILSRSGHVAALVNPVNNPKANFRAASGRHPSDPDEWVRSASEHSGSWWPDWTSWLSTRSGALKAAPKKLGDPHHPPLEPAPGRYVLPDQDD